MNIRKLNEIRSSDINFDDLTVKYYPKHPDDESTSVTGFIEEYPGVLAQGDDEDDVKNRLRNTFEWLKKNRVKNEYK